MNKRRMLSAFTAKRIALDVWHDIYLYHIEDKYMSISEIKHDILANMLIRKDISKAQFNLIERRSCCPLCAYYSVDNNINFFGSKACCNGKNICPLANETGHRKHTVMRNGITVCFDKYMPFYILLNHFTDMTVEKRKLYVKRIIDRIEKWDISDLDNGHIDVKL